MRLLIDSLIALMLVAVLAGVLIYHQRHTQEIDAVRQVHQALAAMQEQVLYQGAIDQGDEPTDESRPRFPDTLSPLWFGAQIPRNVLVPGRQPWVDLAPADDNGDHPPDPVISANHQAGFWYNPARGIVRARVTAQFTEHETLALYNLINGTALRELPEAVPANRRPRPLDYRLAMHNTHAADATRQQAAPQFRPTLRSTPAR